MRHCLPLGYGCALVIGVSGATERARAADRCADSASAIVDTGDVVVTATRTGPVRLQDIPLAITVIRADTIERTGAKDIRDLPTLTPNVQVTRNAAFAQIYIRGAGSNNVFGGSDPSSSIHLDGVYLGRPSSYLLDFLDVARIEVLRGPQGTLYGRNTIGGTINVISRKPSGETQARVQTTVGNYGLIRSEGYVSGPLVRDALSASLSVLATRRDGYLKNVVAGVGDVDGEDTSGVRGQLRWTPVAPVELVIRADYLKSKDTLAGYVKLLQPTADPRATAIIGDYRKVALDLRSASNRRQQGISGELTFDPGNEFAIKSITAYRENRLIQVGDTDGSALTVRRTDQAERQHQFSQELTASGTLGRFTYLVGANLYDENIRVDSNVTNFTANRLSFQPVIDTQSTAGFGQASYRLLGGVTVSAGVRYTRERKDFAQFATQTSVAGRATIAGYPQRYARRGIYTAWTPKFLLGLRPVPALLAFVSVTNGFKSGGFNVSSINPAQGFDPERLWSYEAGVKAELAGGRFRLNANVFRYDYKNLQVQSFLSPGVSDIANAADARIVGIEIEPVLKPLHWLEVGGSLTTLDARYRDYANALAGGVGPFDATGKRLSLAPAWAYSLYGAIDAALGRGGMFGRVELSRRARQYFTAANRGLDQQAPYGLLNVSMGYRFPGDRVQLLAFARNLTNTAYVTSTASFTLGISGRVGDPRSYGLRLAASF